MVYVGMDVHQKSTTFCILDPSKEEGAGRYRTIKRETGQEAFDEVPGALATEVQGRFRDRYPGAVGGVDRSAPGG